MSLPAEIPVLAGQRRGASGTDTGEREKAGFFVVAVKSSAELQPYLAAWDDLSAASLEPNVFYESWMLVPALENYGRDANVTIVLVFKSAAGAEEPLLCGLFPIELQRRMRVVQVRSFWRYVHCYLNVPLVRAGHGRPCLHALFDWLEANRHDSGLLECDQITAGGPFHALLVEHLREQDALSLVTATHTRPLLREGDSEAYLQTVLSSEKRKKLRRAEKRLGATGPVEYRLLTAPDDVEAWVADFLRLEATGWKGRQGTALSCCPYDLAFFKTVVRGAYERGRLMMLALQVGGRPIAVLCNFLAPPGSFAFKVAFDEEYAASSPGVLLEIENVRRVQANPQLDWMDSCSESDTTPVLWLWNDRRVIQTVLVSARGGMIGLYLAALPLLRWLRKSLASWKSLGTKKSAGLESEEPHG